FPAPRGRIGTIMRQLTAIIKKEFRHIVRDWQTLIIVLAMPVVLMFLYGYALDVTIKDVPVIVEDPAPSPESRAMIKAIDNSELFKVTSVVTVAVRPQECFRGRSVKALFRFPADFAANLRRPLHPAMVQVLIDGSDQNTGTIISNAVEPFLTRAALNLLNQSPPIAVSVQQTVLYNPRQKSALFFVPGLMAMILMMISALLTALAITREKELGTMEQLLVTPLTPMIIIIGKLIPYVVLAAIDGMLILAVGEAVFGVRIQGSSFLLAGASVIYIITALALGLLISTIARKQEHALLMVLPLTMLPTMLLSGFIFPLASLPPWLQILASAVPATYFLQIIRGIILKGVGLSALWKPIAVLSAMGLILMIISIKKFKVRL
ncbi:MAG TPA: ABC transporter permease, partial [Chitinivibrionales bacterium]